MSPDTLTRGGMAPPRPRAPRRDASRSRRAILDAAERLLTERGGAVPMYEVARAAGVGQATLYRHFPDRSALVGAVLEGRIEALEEVAARHADDPGCALELLRAIVGHQASSAAILGVLRETGDHRAALPVIAQRTRRLIAGPIATAVAAGRVRRDFGVDDFLLVLSMVDGALERGADDRRAERSARTLDLVLSGIAR